MTPSQRLRKAAELVARGKHDSAFDLAVDTGVGPGVLWAIGESKRYLRLSVGYVIMLLLFEAELARDHE